MYENNQSMEQARYLPHVEFDKGAKAFCFFCAVSYVTLGFALVSLALTLFF